MSYSLPTYNPNARAIQRFLAGYLSRHNASVTPERRDGLLDRIRELDLHQCATTAEYTAYHQALLEGLARALRMNDVRVPEIPEGLPEGVDGHALAFAQRLVTEARAREHLLVVSNPPPGHNFTSWPEPGTKRFLDTITVRSGIESPTDQVREHRFGYILEAREDRVAVCVLETPEKYLKAWDLLDTLVLYIWGRTEKETGHPITNYTIYYYSPPLARRTREELFYHFDNPGFDKDKQWISPLTSLYSMPSVPRLLRRWAESEGLVSCFPKRPSNRAASAPLVNRSCSIFPPP